MAYPANACVRRIERSTVKSWMRFFMEPLKSVAGALMGLLWLLVLVLPLIVTLAYTIGRDPK